MGLTFPIFVSLLFARGLARKLMIASRNIPIDISPYSVSISVRDDEKLEHVCSGSLIGPDIVLTAAHCLYGVSVGSVAVIVGSDNLLTIDEHMVYKVKSFVHPGFVYEGYTVKNDIALLFLTQCVSTDLVTEFAVITRSVEDVYEGKCIEVDAVGFGKHEHITSNLFVPDGKLRGLFHNQRVHSSIVCKEAFINGFNSSSLTESQQILLSKSITSKMGCYGGNSFGIQSGYPCRGDSGSGVVSKHDGVLLGITSFSAETCGTLPNYYSKIGAYSDWIIDQITRRKYLQCANDIPISELFDHTPSGRSLEDTSDIDAAPVTDIRSVVDELVTVVQNQCFSQYMALNNELLKGQILVNDIGTACESFRHCIGLTDIVFALLNEFGSDIDDTMYSFETKLIVSRYLLCTSSTYEMFYNDINIKMNSNIKYMDSINPDIDCPA